MENCLVSCHCLVCLVQFTVSPKSDQISLVPFTKQEDEEEDSKKRKEILRIFCTYFNLTCKQNDNDNVNEEEEIESEILPSLSFPLCPECTSLVVELSICHDQIQSLQNRIQNTVAKITIKIINTENDRKNYSSSDSLENHSQEPAEKGSKNQIKYGYRRRILQNFNPQVHLTNCQSQIEKSQKKVTGQTTNTNEINSTTTEIKSEPVLNDEDCHDNSINNVDFDVAVEIKSEEEDDDDAEIPENSSSHSSSSSEAEEEENDNLNLKKKSRKNVIKRISTKSKFNTHSTAKDPLDLNSNSDNRNGMENRKSLENQMRSPAIENLGDGKFLYKKCWPFHIMENSEHFQCDTCQTKKPFPKNPNKKIYTHIFQHIAREHMHCYKNVKQNVDDGKFQFLDNKCTFEKTEFGFKCGHCTKMFTKFVSLKSHSQVYHMPGEFECPKCSLSCQTEGILRRHNCVGQLQINNKSYQVSPGKFIYNGKKGNWEFERLADGKFQCGSCPAIRKEREKISSHIQIYHDSGTEQMCDECGKIFALKSVLRKHKRIHLRLAGKVEAPKKPPESRVNCPHCPKTYKIEAGLRVHVFKSHKDKDITMTTEETQGNLSSFKYPCGICSKKFNTLLYLKKHHEICTELICPQCGKKFEERGNFKTHLQTHDKVLKFFCEICDKGFLQKSMLVRHTKTETHLKKMQEASKSNEEPNPIHFNSQSTTQKGKGKRKREEEEDEGAAANKKTENSEETTTTETDIVNTCLNFS